ncbi:MAG: cation:proton antiporter [Sterolibacteriaceae bacterium]|nr:cation:proton antiporter [Candidatus Methylophosphatis haderslevensis]
MTSALELVLLLLAAAVMVVVLFRYLNWPPILGYLLVGAAVGPHAFDLLPAHSDANHIAEFGVVFLMFSIGLEFSLPKLYSMKRIVFGLGAAQVLLTALFVTAGLIFFGLSWRGAVAIGAVMAMSSTAVVSKLLVERMQLDSPHGREVMGVLLFQDLAVVPSLILIPALGGSAEQMGSELAIALLKAIVVLAVILFFGQRLMRGWFHVVAKRKSTELFMLNILLVTLGLAWITELAGLSLALGAFVAGMLISETEYRYQVEEDIKPFRDVLMGLFFVTIGMLLNLDVVAQQAIWVVLTLVLLLLLKFAVAAGLSYRFGASPGTALRTGLWLCAGGEFGFVLLALTGRAALVPVAVLQVVLAALVLSLVLAPLISQYADKIVLRLVPSEWLLRSMQLTRIATQSMFIDRHAIICGFGRNGQYLARFLEQEEITYIALDLDPERVKEASAAGETVVFGDAARRETLTAAGISRAAVVVVTYADTASALRVIDMVRGLRPDVPVVVRTTDERDYDKLSKAGAAEVVPESFESSIMLASHALVLMGVPVGRVLSRIREIRGKRYRLLRGIYRGADHLSEEGIANLHKARLHSVTLPAGAWCVGRRIGDLQFEQIEVQVTAMRRRGIRAMDPDADTVLKAEDVVVLLGEPERLGTAEERLLSGFP